MTSTAWIEVLMQNKNKIFQNKLHAEKKCFFTNKNHEGKWCFYFK